jgi:hypothetical protein
LDAVAFLAEAAGRGGLGGGRYESNRLKIEF